LRKNRQDERIAHIIDNNYKFKNEKIGTENAAIINNLVVDIIEHSYGKDYILLSEAAYKDLKTAKQENYEVIYNNPQISSKYNDIIKPMFKNLYYKLLEDVKSKDYNSLIYKHHILFIEKNLKYYNRKEYQNEDANEIVVDYIASMTDDYFIALYKQLFPQSDCCIEYKSYFE